jgi:hypothetical protein
MIRLLIDSNYFQWFYIGSLPVSVLLGYFYAQARYVRRGILWKPSGMEAALIGFYGLLVSFTLLQSGNYNRDRIQLIHSHAEALGRVNSAKLSLPDSVRAMITVRLKDIIDQKRKIMTSPLRNLTANYAQTDKLYRQTRKDLEVLKAKGYISKQDFDDVISKMQRCVELDYRVRASFSERTPTAIMLSLIIGSWLIGIMIGFMNGFQEKPSTILVPIIFIMLTLLTVLSIRDYDNPMTGSIKPSFDIYEKLDSWVN